MFFALTNYHGISFDHLVKVVEYRVMATARLFITMIEEEFLASPITTGLNALLPVDGGAGLIMIVIASSDAPAVLDLADIRCLLLAQILRSKPLDVGILVPTMECDNVIAFGRTLPTHIPTRIPKDREAILPSAHWAGPGPLIC